MQTIRKKEEKENRSHLKIFDSFTRICTACIIYNIFTLRPIRSCINRTEHSMHSFLPFSVKRKQNELHYHVHVPWHLTFSRICFPPTRHFQSPLSPHSECDRLPWLGQQQWYNFSCKLQMKNTWILEIVFWFDIFTRVRSLSLPPTGFVAFHCEWTVSHTYSICLFDLGRSVGRSNGWVVGRLVAPFTSLPRFSHCINVLVVKTRRKTDRPPVV